MLDFRAMTHGCPVSELEMARRLGDAYLEILHGAEEHARQQPLVAAEQDDCWKIEGSWNRDGAMGEQGWFYATIWKHDGRLVDFGIHLKIEYSAADRALINRRLKSRRFTPRKIRKLSWKRQTDLLSVPV
jgi:hypothetical protein